MRRRQLTNGACSCLDAQLCAPPVLVLPLPDHQREQHAPGGSVQLLCALKLFDAHLHVQVQVP